MGHWGLIMLGDNRIAGGILKGELSCGKSGLSDLLAICEGGVIKGGKKLGEDFISKTLIMNEGFEI